jgi:DNA-binding response OmpR family regulator
MDSRGLVLLVDDDRDIAFGTAMRLRAAGYKTLLEVDGVDGVASARKYQPDVILLDVRMPRMDGFQALAELRLGDDTKGIPVIMLSASMRDQQAALDGGARFFQCKPYEPGDLLAAVETAICEADDECSKS